MIEPRASVAWGVILAAAVIVEVAWFRRKRRRGEVAAPDRRHSRRGSTRE